MKKNKKYKILLYHGVSNYSNYKGIENFSKKHISKSVFLKQMKYLKKTCNLISFNDLTKYKKRGEIPKNTVLITFDDGFENNYKVAFPILKKLKIPAIFYVSAGMIGKEKMFWVDKIEDIINRTSERTLKIKLKKKENFNLLNNMNKIKAVNRIKKFCKNASAKQKEKTIKDLIRLCKVQPINKYSKNYRVMSWKQVRKIASNDLFEIGGHSLNHDILTKLTSSQMKKDVKNSIKILKNKLNSKVIHYSYPEGQISDYNKNIKIYLKSLGIKFCPTAVHGISSINDDEFETKRIMVGINDQKFPFKKFYN